jgi:ankyrin repeat protein
MVKELLKRGFDPNYKVQKNLYLLSQAIRFNSFTKTKMLLEHKANLKLLSEDPEFRYKLYKLFYENRKLFELLVEFGLNLDDENMILTSLAVRNGDITILEYLIKNKVPIDFKPLGRKISLLHLALVSKQDKIIKHLLKSDYNPNEIYLNGNNPLHLAVINGNVDTVKLLMEYGLDPSTVNKGGYKPIDYAQNKPEILKALQRKT